MEIHGSSSSNLSTQPEATRRRLLFFPLPFQGHINPMLQLANILQTKGFKITIIHTEYNPPNYSNYPDFTFKSIHVGVSEIPVLQSTKTDINYYISKLNEISLLPFRVCIAELIAESDEEPVACLITDALWYFAQAVADDLKIPRMVLRTSSLSCIFVYAALPVFLDKGYFNISEQEYDAPVLEFPPLKVKDIVKMTSYPQDMSNLVTNMVKAMKVSSGIIWNTFRELEQPAFEAICQEFEAPNFTLGPFHKYFPASSSSLLEQDRSIISWLDAQSPKSVIYVSFGTGAHISELEFQELAHGLANSMLPFLWAVRPGVVHGSKWIESLPEKFQEQVVDRGRIVKWAPQQEVLAHPSTGCFWTHSGWNSTLESICEGVPMICSPCFVDQPINARYVCDEWKIGVLLENGMERVEIDKSIKRLMVDKEGEEMRETTKSLKQKGVADELNIPRMVLRTSCLSCTHVYAALPVFLDKGYFNVSGQEYEASVPEYEPLKIKDIVKMTSHPQAMTKLMTNMVKTMKASSGLIWNSFQELEQTSYEAICQEFQVPSFTLGPFHKYFPASSSSLLEQDRSIISWLDAQSPKSVMYVSFGSVARINELEFQEMAHALANSKLPFLWVVRPGVVYGSEWLESLPEKFLEQVVDRGRIVKWAPQQEVLAHPATGCFWTHNGWNSTLESICEGVPMICSPCFVDQPINARYVCDEWKIGVLLEKGLESGEIDKAIKRLMVDKEGEEIRKRTNSLKEKVNLSLEKGGSSHQSLESLVDYLLAL